MHVIEKPMKKDIYRNGGWLPSKYIMDEWRAPLIQSVQTDIDQKDEFKHRSVKELASIIRNDPNLKDLVDKMIEENKILYNAKSLEKECKIKSGAIPTVEHMFMAIDKILDQGPHWHKGHLVGIPLAALFTGVNATLSGQAVFRNVVFNKALRAVLQEWGDFLDKPESFPRGNGMCIYLDTGCTLFQIDHLIMITINHYI